MLLWAGLFLIALGIACIAVDRRAVHVIYDHVGLKFHQLLDATTHLAKAGHWLAADLIVLALSWGWLRLFGTNATAELVEQCALAFIASLALGSAVLHGTKLILGRRRPRDELDMGLYGFVLFRFDRELNSFPSGHALTIMCVAVLAAALWPQALALWFAIALWLGLTRALLNAHFLSDVLVGAGVGMVSAREVLVNFFPALAPGWF
jgi:membrane-associated phospholipid phosphatase